MMGGRGAYTSTIGPAERNASMVRYVEFDGEVLLDRAVSERGDGICRKGVAHRVLKYADPSEHIQKRTNCYHPVQVISDPPKSQHRTPIRKIQRS